MTTEDMRAAFEAGREYHNPGHRIPILRWKNFAAWQGGLETHMEYGKETQRRIRDNTNRAI